MAKNNGGPFAFRLPTADELRPRKRARQARAKATVEAIHEAALQVLAGVGYDRLTTTAVAERAGVSVGTLYQYYADKLSLVRALIVEYLGKIGAALQDVLAQPSDLPALARAFIDRFVAFKVDERACSLALRTVLVLTDAQLAISEGVGVVNGVLEQRIAAARPDWSAARVRHAATMWTATVFGTTHELLERDPEAVAQPWFRDGLEASVLALLEAPPAPRRA